MVFLEAIWSGCESLPLFTFPCSQVNDLFISLLPSQEALQSQKTKSAKKQTVRPHSEFADVLIA